MPKRIEYLDIARGIGILLVVLGHNDFAALSPFFHQVIYSFHIPLFFFLSGYFINASISFFEYSRKRFHDGFEALFVHHRADLFCLGFLRKNGVSNCPAEDRQSPLRKH